MWRSFLAEQRLRGLSPRTIERRRWSVGLFERHCQTRGRTLVEATTDDVESWLIGYPDPQTRYSLLCDLRQLYRCALRRDLVGADVTVGVPMPRLPKRGASPVSWHDVERCLEVADQTTRLMILIAVYSGLRCSEIAALRGEDIHPHLIVVRQGKGGKDSEVPLAAELAAALHGWPRHGRLFPAATGQRVGARIRKVMRSVEVMARPHDLRHTYGTACAIKAGGNIFLTASLMRHENIASTERYVRWHTTGQEIVSGLYAAA